jgi:DNA-binding transcriptional ArsR family regulator
MQRRISAQIIDRDTAETYATWFTALADPTRVQILNILATAPGPLSVGQIAEHTDVLQPTVSHHLRILRAVGAVSRERHGTTILYTLNLAAIACYPRAANAVMGRPAPDLP